ncbi:hypothetical protein BDZ89DRAFT_1074697 [Hymenopellis radicata]|nr:hypothetical protein BDZ89DRAFT_1074697 [Hymenopellis radicata]
MTVEESVHYPVSGTGARAEWASYSPDGYGYLRLGAEYRAFALSFLHEDHCLRLIRTMLDGTASNLTLTETIPYCLNYIRQIILCDPNLTLEPADVLERDYDVQRSGATHVCFDWRVIHAELGKNWKDWYNYKKSQEL